MGFLHLIILMSLRGYNHNVANDELNLQEALAVSSL